MIPTFRLRDELYSLAQNVRFNTASPLTQTSKRYTPTFLQFSSLPSKNVMIKTHKIIILSTVLYGSET